MLEIIAFNIATCAKAQQAGADRIELCADPAAGGTTPSAGFLQAARKVLSIPLFAMIRPRGGDFLYSDADFEIMKSDVVTCKSLGCDGIVTGILDAAGNIDVTRVTQLVTLAYPMEVTFHRAFDRANTLLAALDDVIATGCTCLLTSGQQKTAEDGAQQLAALEVHNMSRINIMAGSGVRAANITDIANKTNLRFFHSSAQMHGASAMQFLNPAMAETFTELTVDVEEIKSMKGELAKFNLGQM